MSSSLDEKRNLNTVLEDSIYTSPENLVFDQQSAIEQTGCGDLNDKVLLCYDEHRDWRACKDLVNAFRECYNAFKNEKPINKPSDEKNSIEDL